MKYNKNRFKLHKDLIIHRIVVHNMTIINLMKLINSRYNFINLITQRLIFNLMR